MEPYRIRINTLYSLEKVQDCFEIQYDDMITRAVCVKTGKILEPSLKPENGYYYYTMDSTELGNNGKYKRTKVYLQKINHLAHNNNGPYEQINHEDGNKKNNSPANLHPCTAKENVQHAYRNHLVNREKHVFMIIYNDGLRVQGTPIELYDRMGIRPKKIYDFYENKGTDDRYKYNIHSIVRVN